MKLNFSSMKIRAAIAAAALLLSSQAFAAPDFKAMLKEIDDLSGFTTQDLSMKMTIVAKKPDEPDTVYQWSIFRRDERDQIVLLFLKPEAQKGQGILKIDDDVWMYDPDSGKYTHSSMKENIEKSDAKASDMKGYKFAVDYDIKSGVEGTLGKYPVWILTLKANNKEVSYDWLRIYVRKDKAVLLKEEAYSPSEAFEKATLLRTRQFPPEYIEVSGKSVPKKTLITDELNKGNKTVTTIEELSVGKLDNSTFSKAFLTTASKK